MDSKKINRNILKSFSPEEIQSHADSLDLKELEEFVVALEKSNMEMEEGVNRKITSVKNKKSNLSLLLKRVWLNLKEEEKEKMAGFFDELSRFARA